MTLEKTEILQVEFPVYRKSYQTFFLRLTGSRDIIPTYVELTREGKKEFGETEWTWTQKMGQYEWTKLDHQRVKFEQLRRTTIAQPKDDLIAQLYAFYDEIRANPSCHHSGSLEMKLTYKNSYIDRLSSLLLLYHFKENRSNPKLAKRMINIIFKELSHRARPIEIASLIYDEDTGIDECEVSDKHLRRKTIGAMKGFLEQEDANYRLREAIPRDLYNILTEASRMRGE